MSLRSHSNHGYQPRVLNGLRVPASAGRVPVGPRGQRFARQGQAAPGCRLHPKNKRPSDPDFKCHPQAPGNRWACGRRPLTSSGGRSQLWAPVASWPAPSRSKRRCGRYPPFKSPDLSSRGGCGLQGLAPEEFHFVVPAPACQLCPLGVPSRTRRCLEQMVRTAPDAARCSRHPSSLRILRRTRPCLPLMGSPCVFARQPGTALDFRSGADPCRWMTLRIED